MDRIIRIDSEGPHEVFSDGSDRGCEIILTISANGDVRLRVEAEGPIENIPHREGE